MIKKFNEVKELVSNGVTGIELISEIYSRFESVYADSEYISHKVDREWRLIAKECNLDPDMFCQWVAYSLWKNKNSLELKVKRLYPESKMPYREHKEDAGLDLYVHSIKVTDKYVSIGTGIAVEIPDEYVGYLFPRSSIFKTGLELTNCVGVIDSNYRGEIKAEFRIEDWSAFETNGYNIGDRCIQLIIMPYPKVLVREVDELSKSSRGTKGFGSTGK